MQRYGKLINGELLTSDHLHLDYKPIEYEKIPEGFNQETHFITQGEAVDEGDYIFVKIEIDELQSDEETEEFDIDLDSQ